MVVGPSDLVRSTGTLSCTALARLLGLASYFLLLFNVTKFGLNTELVVTTLFLPE